MISLRETMRGGREIEQSRPWPRHVVDHTSWLRAIREISKGQGDMLGLWSDGADVHMLLLDHESSDIGIVSHRMSQRTFSLRRPHASAGLAARTRDSRHLRNSKRTDRPMSGVGSITAVGACDVPARSRSRPKRRETLTPFSPRKARRSTKSRWDPFTPASSNLAISVFQRMGKSSSALRNGSVTPTRA